MEEETVIKVEADELIIEPINGKVIDLENSDLSVGKIVFKKKENELPTTWDDLYEEKKRDEALNFFPTEEERKAVFALRGLCWLRDAYNGEPLADWCDWSKDNDKYVIIFTNNEIYKTSRGNSQEVLTFKTKKLRDKFAENFEDLILTAKPLL